MQTFLHRGMRIGVAVAAVALLPLWADAAKRNAGNKKNAVGNCDKVTAVDVAKSTVTVFARIKNAEVTYPVTTNTEIFVFHDKVGLEALKSGMNVSVTAEGAPEVATRIDGVDKPPAPPKPPKPAGRKR
ncbi:MAG: hypothetical protein NTV49_00360 [Kiritimatiellaeota bacterium]|nr:hypothetical protein [Kiritimatiellota bacterium]